MISNPEESRTQPQVEVDGGCVTYEKAACRTRPMIDGEVPGPYRRCQAKHDDVVTTRDSGTTQAMYTPYGRRSGGHGPRRHP